MLAMFRSLERRGSPRFSYKGSIKLLVPPFNVGKIFCPSYMNYEQAIGTDRSA